MKNKKTTSSDLIRELIESSDEEMCDEELMHLLITQKVSANIYRDEGKGTFGQRAADAVAKFTGSWAFIFSFFLCLLAWMLLNTFMSSGAFDKYPFILLNLVLSCIAAVQAPLIMMSQNRQESKDRARSDSDYRINLKNELVIDDLHHKLDKVLENQENLSAEIEKLKMQNK